MRPVPTWVVRSLVVGAACLSLGACAALEGGSSPGAPSDGGSDEDTGASDEGDEVADDPTASDTEGRADGEDADAEDDAASGGESTGEDAGDGVEAEGGAEEPRGFTMAATGDILPHTPLIERAAEYGVESGQEYDFRPMFRPIEPILSAADLSVCHLEVPLSADNEDVYGGGDRRTETGSPLFLAPWQLAEAIGEAGYDVCSTAHNHSTDAGDEGIVDTLDALEDAGVTPAGTARTREDETLARVDVGGVDVAILSATYGLNIEPDADAQTQVDVIDLEELETRARQVREDGAEFVVASLHQGIEYQIEPSDNQRERADVLLGSDEVDLIIGHHAHVVQPIERVHDRVAVLGLGNLLSNMDPRVTGAESQDGVVVLLEVTEEPVAGTFEVTEVRYVPTWVDRDRTHEIVDVGAVLEEGGLDQDRRAELEASWERTVDAITRDGADEWGVQPVTGAEWSEQRGDGSDD